MAKISEFDIMLRRRLRRDVVLVLLMVLACYIWWFRSTHNIMSLVNAAKSNELDRIVSCVNWGAPVNGIARRGWYNTPDDTPLTAAIIPKHFDAVKLLVRLGADVNLENGFLMTPAGTAACSGDIAIINYLAEQGADFVVKSGQFTPLEWASNTRSPKPEVIAAIRKILEPQWAN